MSERDMENGRRIASVLVTLGKQQATFAAHMSKAGVDRSALVLLKTLDAIGPCRSGTLAETLHSDPSTVSRQVAAAVKDGLLERAADPEDGRATLLTPTERGRELLAVQRERVARSLAAMVSDWDPSDVDTFVDLFERFLAAHETYLPTLIGECVRHARSGGEN